MANHWLAGSNIDRVSDLIDALAQFPDIPVRTVYDGAGSFFYPPVKLKLGIDTSTGEDVIVITCDSHDMDDVKNTVMFP